MRSLHIAGLVLAGVCLASAGAEQSEPETGGLPMFTGEVDVGVVTLDVMVTDRRGRPITGLPADAFRVFEDGREVELSNFLEIRDGRMALAGDQTVAPPEEDISAMPKATTNAAGSTAPAEPVSVVVYVDLQFLRTRGLQLAVRELERFFAERWTPGNRAMLAVSSGALHAPVPFTEDPEKVIAGLAELHRVVGHMDAVDEERFGWQTHGGSGFSNQDSSAAESFAQLADFVRSSTIEEQRMRALRSVHSLRAMVDQLALGPGGRRMLLMLSDGLPPLWTRRQLDQLIDHANANRVSVYALLGGGEAAASAPVLSAERHGMHSGLWRGGRGRRGDAFDDARGAEGTVEHVAWRTGGKVLAEVSSTTLEQLASDLRSYYSVGYRSPTPGDGALHSIEVKVDYHKARVRHRLEYRSFTDEDKLAGAAIAALVAAQPDNPLGFTWTVPSTAETAADRNGFVVPVTIELPLQQVVLVPGDERLTGSVRVFLAGLHSADELTPLRGVRLQIAQPRDLLGSGETIVHHAEIMLPAGRATIAVTVFDEIAEETSSKVRWIKISKDGTIELRPSPFASGDET